MKPSIQHAGVALMAALALLCSSPLPGRADAVANIKADGAVFKSAQGKALAVLGGGGISYTVKVNGQTIYATMPEPRLNLGSVYLSEDGRLLVWVLADHFLMGRGDHLKAPAVIFFKDGKRLKSYSLEELLVRPKMVSYSASHIQWLPSLHDEHWKFSSPVNFLANEGKLLLETTSMRKYAFDCTSGKMLTAEDNDVYRSADILVYGELDGGDGKLSLKRGQIIKGDLSADALKGAVIMDPTGTFSSGYHTLALKKVAGAYVVSAPEYNLSTIYNAL